MPGTLVLSRQFNPSVVSPGSTVTVSYTITLTPVAMGSNSVSIASLTDLQLHNFVSFAAVPNTLIFTNLMTGGQVLNPEGMKTGVSPFQWTADSINPPNLGFFLFTNNFLIPSARLSFDVVAGAPAVIPAGSFSPFTGFNVTFNTFQNPQNVSVGSTTGGLIITNTPCVSIGTELYLTNGNKKKVEDLHSGDNLKAINGTGSTTLKSLVELTNPTYQLYRVDAAAFQEGSSQSLMIRPGHPMYHQLSHCEVYPEDVGELVNLDNPRKVFTLLTENKEFVIMNDIPVATWSEAAWNNLIENDPDYQNLEFTLHH